MKIQKLQYNNLFIDSLRKLRKTNEKFITWKYSKQTIESIILSLNGYTFLYKRTKAIIKNIKTKKQRLQSYKKKNERLILSNHLNNN